MLSGITRRAAVLVCVVGLAGCADEAAPSSSSSFPLPKLLVSGKYIDYGTWANTSRVCMDERLAAWDRYIKLISARMGIAPPVEKIRYTWVPEGGRTDRWPCDPPLLGCALSDANSEDYQSYVFARDVEMLHELVHAVEIPAFGEANSIFSEGMAEYLSRSSSTASWLPGFSDAMMELFDRTVVTEADYARSMHFVGTLVKQGGLKRFYKYRSRVPRNATHAEFAAAYSEIYGGELMYALENMELIPISGAWLPWGCSFGEIAVTWKEPGLLNATLAGSCGDGDFYGGGFAEGQFGFSKVYTVEVKKEAVYELSLRGKTGEPGKWAATLSSCPGTDSGDVYASSEHSREKLLRRGLYSLRVDFPSASEARGEVQLKLRSLDPVP